MCLCGPNNVESAVQTDPTLLPYDSVIAEPKECWELLVSYFAQQLLTTRNNMLHGVQLELVIPNIVTSVCTELETTALG